MLKQLLHIVLSFFLAVLLLFGGTPKEFIHCFAAHQDTSHAHHESGKLYFENEHHHCDFLSFSLAPFVEPQALPVLKPVIVRYYERGNSPVHPLKLYTPEEVSLRGPPAACLLAA